MGVSRPHDAARLIKSTAPHASGFLWFCTLLHWATRWNLESRALKTRFGVGVVFPDWDSPRVGAKKMPRNTDVSEALRIGSCGRATYQCRLGRRSRFSRMAFAPRRGTAYSAPDKSITSRPLRVMRALITSMSASSRMRCVEPSRKQTRYRPFRVLSPAVGSLRSTS